MTPVLNVNFRPLPYFVGKNLRVNLDLAGLAALGFRPGLAGSVCRAGRQVFAIADRGNAGRPARAVVRLPAAT